MAASHKWWVLIGVCLLGYVGFLDFTIVNTILPGIQRDLSASVSELQWVMTGFLMMLTMFMVTMGRLGDIYGCRLVLYAGAAVFGVASLGAGLSWNPTMLIAFRIVQGIACAVTFTCSAALITLAWPESERGRALGIYAAITGSGLAAGPVLGGIILSVLSWRWAFFINLPIIVAGFIVCRRFVGETPRQPDVRIDWPGLVLLVSGIGCFVTPILQAETWGWGSPLTLGLLVVGVVVLAIFVAIEHRVAAPILNFRLLANRSFLVAGIAGLALGACLSVGMFLSPLYLQSIRNAPGYATGLMLLPITALVIIVAPLTGRPVDRTGPFPFLVVGTAFLCSYGVAQAFVGVETPVWLFLAGLGLLGLGWGLQQSTGPVAASEAVPKDSAGLALGALWTLWNVGTSVGLAIGGAIFKRLDNVALTGKLSAKAIDLSPGDLELVRSLLSDPATARQTLAELTPGVEQEVLPIFAEAFVAGYRGAMWFLAGVAAAALAAMLPLMKGMWRKPIVDTGPATGS